METDLELLNVARTMNKEALVKIFDLYASPLYRYVLRLCGDPMLADQVVGDVFAKLLDQLSAGNGPQAHLRPYLYEMAYHRMIDETRYSKRQAPFEAAEWLGQFADPESLSLELRLLFKQILVLIQHDLTSDQQHVITLRFFEEFSLRETAELIGKKESHVKVIQNRAIAKLRKALEHSEARTVMLSPAVGNQSRPLGV